MPLKYGSVCSGVEAASLAWEGLGWEPVFFSEIEPFPSAVLAERWPSVPNMGDMTRYEEWDVRPGSIDVFVGGTPCQSFSVAGLRGGLDDERGNLALVYARMVDYLRPRWFVWENVPGVLSSNGGRDFGSILGAFQQLGYSFAYRVLDAQYFGVPQRRRRVFVVGHLGDWRGPAAVLFEPESLRRDSQANGEAGKAAADGTGNRTQTNGWPKRIAPTLDCDFATKHGQNNQHIQSGAGLFVPAIANCLTSSPSTNCSPNVSNGQGTVISTQTARGPQSYGLPEVDGGQILPATAFCDLYNQTVETRASPTLTRACEGTNTSGPKLLQKIGVRRLTPTECERLQGFPDGHTLITYKGKPAPDGPRYKAIGNSMAVPVMRWIGQRIAKYSACTMLKA